MLEINLHNSVNNNNNNDNNNKENDWLWQHKKHS